MEKPDSHLYAIIACAPPARLEKEIMVRIAGEERKYRIIRTISLGSVAALSCGACIMTSVYVVQDATSSGFSEYLYLVFSDSGSLVASWKEFLSLVAETLPAVGIAGVLAAGGATLWSLTGAIKTFPSRLTTTA